MGLDVHTVEMGKGSMFTRTDRVGLIFLPQQAFASGAATLPVTGLELPAVYGVFVGGDSTVDGFTIGSRTNTGFVITFTSAQTAAGALDILIVW
jgi:hypothetical protein